MHRVFSLISVKDITINFKTMKKRLNSDFAGLLIILFVSVTAVAEGQSEKAVVKKYLSELPDVQISKLPQKYRMTAVYSTVIFMGFTEKRVSGDYTRGASGDSSMWNNVYISASNNFSEPFPPEGNRSTWRNSNIFLLTK